MCFVFRQNPFETLLTLETLARNRHLVAMVGGVTKHGSKAFYRPLQGVEREIRKELGPGGRKLNKQLCI